MARKTRRQKQRAAARQTTPTRAPSTPAEPWDQGDAAGVADAESAADEYSIPTDAVTPTDEGVSPGVAAEAPAPVARPAAARPAPSGDTVAPGRRRIERLSQAAPARPARGRGAGNTAAIFQPLDSDDPAIPFDRVPYVPADLRRVAVMALLMVLLIIIAAVVVSHVVH